MDFFELVPTEGNIKNTFINDSIGRTDDVIRMVSILEHIGGGCSIAINGQWGSGKTFFIKQVQLVLDSYNEYLNSISEDDKKEVRDRCEESKQFPGEDFQPVVSVYYDAWINDSNEDPLLSVLYSIIKEGELDYSVSKQHDLVKIATNVFDLVSGKRISNVWEALKGDDYLEVLKREDNIRILFKAILDDLFIERGNQLILFVDELDRCKPSFAIQLLERIKHYLNNENVTFVFSINREQLEQTVRKFYGNDFDAAKYLSRFFDLQIDLPDADMTKYYQALGLNNGNWVYEQVCRLVIQELGLGLRDIAKFYATAKAFAYKPAHSSDNSAHIRMFDGKAWEFGVLYFVPVMIGLRLVDQKQYSDFISGKDGGLLYKVISSDHFRDHYFTQLLNQDETYSRTNDDDKREVTTLENKIKELYEAVFKHDYSYNHTNTLVGEYQVSESLKNRLIRVANGLSNYADYN